METIIVVGNGSLKDRVKEVFSRLVTVIVAKDTQDLAYLVREMEPSCVLINTVGLDPQVDPERLVQIVLGLDESMPIIAAIPPESPRPASLLQAGVHNTIASPCTEEELVWAIENALELRALRRYYQVGRFTGVPEVSRQAPLHVYH